MLSRLYVAGLDRLHDQKRFCPVVEASLTGPTGLKLPRPRPARSMNLTKAVILAGGYGTRLMEETETRPKPMIEIGGRPIIWHIMKIYSAHGINDFVICLGYKGYMLKEYFSNYYLHMADVTFDLAQNKMELHENKSEPW